MSTAKTDIELAAMLRAAEDGRREGQRGYIERASSAVRSSPNKSFDALARVSGLDPKRHFRFADWRGMDFSGCNLRGFDFTGARLWGARFDDALIGPGLDREGKTSGAAIFDQAEWSAVSYDREPGSNDPGVLLATVADLSEAADYADYVGDWKPGALRPQRSHLRPGAIFQDAPFAPQMVVVPSGVYLQGDERQRVDGIYRREVSIRHSLAVGRFPVTFREWDFCQAGDGTSHKPVGEWGRGQWPVTDVSWHHVTNDYLGWLNWKLRLSGPAAYRLLSEAEWEYCCRSGTETMFSFGDHFTTQRAKLPDDNHGAPSQTVEVGSFPANAWGLHDMHGNVWEWCEDIYHEEYLGADPNGAARVDVPEDGTGSRVTRGGSERFSMRCASSSERDALSAGARDLNIGFRVARTLAR